MIEITNLRTKEQKNEIYLIADVSVQKNARKKWKEFSVKNNTYSYIQENYEEGKEKIELWFKMDIKYRQYICSDRIDAFVVSLLYYAMITGEDIVSNIEMSEKLKHTLNTLVIPFLCKNSGYKVISINCPSTNKPYQTAGNVGTGMSCGIDSLHTLYAYTRPETEKRYRINHLTFLDTGASHYVPHMDKKANLQEINKEAQRISKEKEKRAKTIADEIGMELVCIQSNVSDLYQGKFLYSHVYRNLSAILVLQKYFSKYYYSSAGFSLNTFKADLFTPPGYNELLTIPTLSTETTEFICGGKDCTRLEKTKELCDYKYSKKYLNVCNHEQNCGHCTKCYRTLVTLEVLDKLQDYNGTFDIEEFKKNRCKAYLWLLFNRKSDDYAKDIYINAKRKKIIPLAARVLGIIYVPLNKLIRKTK